MKNKFLPLVAIFFSASAYANTTSPLLSYDQFPGDSHVILYTDGSVKASTGAVGAETSVKELGQIAPDSVASIQKMISGVPTDLVLVDPEAHGAYCAMYGGYSYSIYNTSGVAIKIRAESSCHTSYVPSEPQDFRPLNTLIDVLDGFVKLTYLSAE